MKYTLRELRAFKKYTQKELSEKTGLNKMTINTYENNVRGFKKVTYENLEKIADVLGVEVEDIDMDRI